jgi:hypothetical protein
MPPASLGIYIWPLGVHIRALFSCADHFKGLSGGSQYTGKEKFFNNTDLD